MKIDVTIGWTVSDMANGYSSFDGYKPGAHQVTRTIEVDMTGTNLHPTSWPEAIADATFWATNAPRLGYPQGLTGQVARLIDELDYHGHGAHYSLSPGDTVTVGEVTLACDSFGWKTVTLVPPVLATTAQEG